MSELRQCDGCGAVSPVDGLYVANHWYEITVDPIGIRSIYSETKKKFLLCESCFGLGDQEPHFPWLSKLKHALFSWWINPKGTGPESKTLTDKHK